MALPINSAPQFSLKLPTTGEEYFFKPFLVKQEKALMLAMQSEDQNNMVETLKNIVTECFNEKLDVNKISMVDLEYIFLQLRGKSVGELVDLTMKCEKCDPEDKNARVKMQLNLNEIPVIYPDNDPKIHLWDDVGVVMKYPTLEIMQKMDANTMQSEEGMYDVIRSCAEYVYSGDEVFNVAQETPAEFKNFLDNLTNEQFKKIQAFFENMPKLSKEIVYDCPVCGHHHEKRLEGLNSFFS